MIKFRLRRAAFICIGKNLRLTGPWFRAWLGKGVDSLIRGRVDLVGLARGGCGNGGGGLGWLAVDLLRARGRGLGLHVTSHKYQPRS